jgi:hypothetical protein
LNFDDHLKKSAKEGTPMSTIMKIVTSISLAGLLAIAINYFIQSKNVCSFILHVVIIGIAFAF